MFFGQTPMTEETAKTLLMLALLLTIYISIRYPEIRTLQTRMARLATRRVPSRSRIS
jgi:hypothetical protein